MGFLYKIKIGLIAIARINNWWDYFLDYFHLKKGYIVYRIRNKKIITRAGTIDKSIITELVLTDKYFPSWLKLKPDALVIDLGAHIGIFSVLIDRKVYAVEPAEDNYKLLLEQINLNKLDIKPFKIAISNEKGRMKLYRGRHSARFSLIEREEEECDFVNTLSLEEFFIKNNINYCDLMKVDIEGGEYKAFYSTPKTIFDKIRKIFLEIHQINGENRDELINFLKNQGFQIKQKQKSFLYAIKSEENEGL